MNKLLIAVRINSTEYGQLVKLFNSFYGCYFVLTLYFNSTILSVADVSMLIKTEWEISIRVELLLGDKLEKPVLIWHFHLSEKELVQEFAA